LEAGSARFGIESADGRNAIFLTGRLHFDVADYLDYKPGSRFAAVQDLNSGVNARRARLGVVGRFMSDWDFNFIYDLGGSGDGFPPDPGALASGLENALVTFSGLKNHGVPLVFDLGYMDVPFGQAESTSSNDIPLVERAAISNVATNIFANDFRSAFGARSFSDRYWVGAYVTGPTSGTNHTTGEQLGAAGRAGYNILYSPEGWFHVEADVGALLKPPAPGGIRSITLADRPELRVDPTQILSTGASLGTAANPLTNAQVYGGGGIASWRNFLVDGEYYQINVNRQGLATNSFNGGYIEGSWILTGEHRAYSPPSGTYLRPVPEHSFLPFDGSCCGAFELAARYSTIDLNDNFIPRPPPGSNSVGGGQQTVYAVGLNWYPNANMRFMFDYLHGKINKRFSTAAGGGISGTPPGTPVGGQFDAVVMRTQVAF
jgi:phosphate-selective porin OprO/OprP